MNEQKRIEQKYRNKLLENAKSQDFANAYDEIHKFFIRDRCETIYKNRFSHLGRIIIDNYPAGTKILGIGSGNAFTEIELAKKGYEVTAIDISEVALNQARQRADQLKIPINILYGDARFLDLEDNSFQVAISTSFVEHLSKKDAKIHLREVKRVLKPLGCYYFYAGNRLHENYRSAGLHLTMYSTKEQ
jgi:ubiquinone/menaquinone biosynthesis C-methylase UbiE